MEELRRPLIASNFPCRDMEVLSKSDKGDVLFFTSPGGEEAIESWKRLRPLMFGLGYYPVLLGHPDEVDCHREAVRIHTQAISEILAAAFSINPQQWFTERKSRQMDDLRRYNQGIDPSRVPSIGEWPGDAAPNHDFLSPFDVVTHDPLDRIAIGLIPTRIAFEVPAYLRLGGWNDCPVAAEHCAVMAHWNRRWGAEIAAATHDVIEMHVKNPPKTRAEAMELAHQQYIYCPDIVDQGTETISNLAAGLLNGSAWFFWWD